jgi:hypothetical protein
MSGTTPLATNIHNERVKLLATILNNAALAFIVAAFIAPAASGHLDLGWHVVTILAWAGSGVGLHFSARAVLGRLR